MRHRESKRDAVSPVIAVILMVAITVVLAAVLFVMVQQYVQDTPDALTAINGTVTKTDEGWTIKIIAGEADKLEAEWYILENGVVNQTATALIILNENSNAGAGNEFVDAGDTFTIADPTHELEYLHFVIAMDGSAWQKEITAY